MTDEQYSFLKIPLLSISVFIHSIIGISSFIFILFYSLNIHNSFIDLLAICIVISFIIYKNCIDIDIYEDIYSLDNNHDIPDYAKDDFIRKYIVKIFNLDTDNTDYTNLRLDKLTNLRPMLNISNNQNITTLFNRKIHYICINIILSVLLITKYNLQYLLPCLIIWFFSTFKI